MKTKTKALLLIAAFIATITIIGALDVQDAKAEYEHCRQMKVDGYWPEGYACKTE
jgi:hypothetical protein